MHRLTLAALALALTPLAQAQQPTHDHNTTQHDGPAPMTMSQPTNLIESQLNHLSSGTSSEPASTPMYMTMGTKGSWMWMLHGEAFVTDTQQSGPRGADKLFSTNWIMPMAMRRLGQNGKYGQLTLRTMFSLEPATVSGRQYPLLFQQGETAFGKPIIDGQHPHNFFMEVAALYDIKLSERTLLSFYAAPIGDPAIGPAAFSHRLTASENPLAALGHHQQDSTHIAYSVVTGGFTHRAVRIELSGFHGGEPIEGRWQFQPSANGVAIDSYSTRITIAPTANWSGQYSIARLTSPESLHPNEDQQRQTASIIYNRPIGAHHDTTSMPGMDMPSPPTGNWATTILWGRTKSLTAQSGPDTANSKENSYLLESLLKFRNRNYAWTRIENAGRSTELLLPPGSPLPAHFEESPIGHVAAFSFGYDRDYRLTRHITAAPGAQFTTYITPHALQSTYGNHPWGVAAFIRLRIAQ